MDAEGGAAAGSFFGPVGTAVGAAIGVGVGLYVLHQEINSSTPAPAPQAAPTAQPGQSDADFVVTPGGTAVATDPARVAAGLDKAPGVTSAPAQSPSGEKGTIYSGVQTKNGPVDVRTMIGSKTNKPRTVFTHPGTNNPKTPDGKATNDKNDSHIPNNSKIPQPPKTPQSP